MISFDPIEVSEVTQCEAQGIKLVTFSDVIEAGKKAKDMVFDKCTENDYPIFSYTSGTTGDSKGVKLTHKMLLASCYSLVGFIDLNREDSSISYLPYPHSFEQVNTYYGILSGSKIGYY